MKKLVLCLILCFLLLCGCSFEPSSIEAYEQDEGQFE